MQVLNWLKSRLFWKILGVYTLLSVVALGGLILALSRSLEESTRQILDIDTRQLLTRIRREIVSPTADDISLILNHQSAAGQMFLLTDGKGELIASGGGNPSVYPEASRQTLIRAVRDNGITLRWRQEKILTAGVRVKNEGTEPGDERFVLLHEDASERFDNLSMGKSIAVQAAIVAWLCGTACLAFVATTIVNPVRMLMRIMRSPEKSLERRDLILALSDRKDEFGSVARALSGIDAERHRRISEFETEQKGLQSTANQLSAILETIADGVIAVDRQEKVLFANSVACEMMDLAPQTMRDRPLFEMIRARDLHEAVAEALEKGEEVAVEFRMPQKDTYISLVVSPGADRGAVLLLHDNTEARKLDIMRRDFVSGVSHELKTPLTVIQACTDTLLEGALEDQQTAFNFLKQIEEQSERLLQLILGMLQLARVESGAQILDREPVDLRDVAETIYRTMRPVAEGKNIELTVSGEEELFVLGDFQALRTITGSIVDNAIKYTSADGHVDISLAEEESAAVLRITDDGIGIPLKDQVRVFERFYRVDRDRNRERGGTGLGLAIVKHLCQAMKADIGLESDAGQGCMIEVRFPIDADEPLD